MREKVDPLSKRFKQPKGGRERERERKRERERESERTGGGERESQCCSWILAMFDIIPHLLRAFHLAMRLFGAKM